MEIKETLALVPTVVSSLKTIKETCDSLNVGFLPQNRQKLKDLQQQVKELEERVQSGFPQLASLTKSYADVSASVRVAKALSDKNHELLGFSQDIKLTYSLLIRIPGEMESNCAEVEKRMTNLPEINTTELGEAKEKIANIRIYLDRLKQVTQVNLAEEEEVNKSKEEARRLTGDIASQYNYLDGTLSRLLNRVLENIGQAKV